MTEARRGGGLALGACGRLAFAGHDLEGDVEPRPLVPREPHRPGPTAAERAQRPVPAEDEVTPLRRERSVRHRSRYVGSRRVISSLAERPVTVWPERPTSCARSTTTPHSSTSS